MWRPTLNGDNPRTGSPVGGGFVAFTASILVLLVLAVTEAPIARSTAISTRLGIVATTVYVLASIVALWRLVSTGNTAAGLIASANLAGAVWSWLMFSQPAEPNQTYTVVVGVVGAGIAVALLAQGLRIAFWLEVFSGLGLVSLVLGTAVVASNPVSASGSVPLALLVGVGGMACLYGGLVDVEVARQRALLELLESRKRIESEMAQTEEILHDLQSGLLAIEAAIGALDGDLAGPLQSEAARLRRLTVRGHRNAIAFDLADRVRELVSTREARGVPVVLCAPRSATVWGEESEVLAIIDNLLSNAERHGAETPIGVQITPTADRIRLSVTNGGPEVVHPELIFEPGVSTHPDGQGIGLTRARALAVRNEGQLALQPTGDGLTTFTLDLRSDPPVPVSGVG